MHLSLKGSLIRSPMLNRVGQRLLQLFEGASAAYSLRDLASNIASVVRVRRASDNSEKDFSAADVSSGAMTQWVNGQVVPPLDVRELVDGERTGALVEAAAAYSLRNLSTSYTGNVVDVRRSSDDAEDSFTAAEVADGTLEDWVNGNWENVNYSTFTNGESWEDGFTAINTTSSGAGLKIPSGTTGDVITISFNLTLNSGTPSPSVTLRNSAGGSVFSNVEVVSTAGSHSLTLTATGSYGYITIGEGDVPSGFSISNVILNVVPNPIFDGFVTQWYDQSGNANHATQGTDASQPKIVSGGTLVSGGLDFDGVDDFLEVTPISTASTALSTFIFGDAQSNVFSYPIGTTNNAGIGVSDTSFRYNLISGTPILEDWSSTLGGKNIYTFIHDGTTSVPNVSGYRNGAIGSQTSAEQGAAPSDNIRYIGTRNQVQDFNGVIGEIIIYPSDQSDNRTAIEANIGDTYNIDLPSGVDTGYDQVDGFVETWYDQSGNGNDAVQQVSGNQPKIVDAGVFLGQVDFLNGVSTFLETNNSDLANLSELSLFSVLEPVTASTNEFAISAGSIVNSTGNYGGWALWANGYSDRFDFTTQARGSGTNSRAQATITSTSPVVYSATLNGTNAQAAVNGVLGTENISMITPYNSDATRRKLRLGCQYTFAPASFYRGAMKEVILYASDQSANREAVEANINNQYDIY